ncbi:hypothetical protein KAR91_74940 [Candidatus Pacearchaeota archaeon]|nr:hypothetical protein [Candidatus Pacearchaeota archaeon]
MQSCIRKGCVVCEDGKLLEDLPKGIVESTSASTTCLIEIRNNNDLIIKLREGKAVLLTMIYDLFCEHCLEVAGTGKETFNHWYMEPYEEAQELLLKEGLITKDQCECS